MRSSPGSAVAVARAFEGCSDCVNVDWGAWRHFMEAAANYDLAQGMIAGAAYAALAAAMWVSSAPSRKEPNKAFIDVVRENLFYERDDSSGFLGTGLDPGSVYDATVGWVAYGTYYFPNRAIDAGAGDNILLAGPLLVAESAGFGIYTASNAFEVAVFDQPRLYTDDRFKSLDPRDHDEPNRPGFPRFFAPGPRNFKLPFAHGPDVNTRD